MLEHKGRKSGQIRRTVLEVVADHPESVYVAAAWGSKAQWLRNIEADPHVFFYLGSRRYEGDARRIDVDSAHAVLGEYAAKNPSILRRLAAFMLDDPGESVGENVSRLAELVPLVRLPKAA